MISESTQLEIMQIVSLFALMWLHYLFNYILNHIILFFTLLHFLISCLQSISANLISVQFLSLSNLHLSSGDNWNVQTQTACTYRWTFVFFFSYFLHTFCIKTPRALWLQVIDDRKKFIGHLSWYLGWCWLQVKKYI